MADSELLFPDAVVRTYDTECTYRHATKMHKLFKNMPSKERPLDIPAEIEWKPKLPCSMPVIGQEYSCTEKKDGTQIHMIIDNVNHKGTVSLLSHNNKPIIQSSLWITPEELRKGDKFGKQFTFQSGRLELFADEISNLWALMDRYGIKIAHFYYELIFPVGKQTPKKIQYPDEAKDKVYMFNMVYNRINDQDETEVVKISVTPHSKPIFDGFGISTVPLIPELTGDVLTPEAFENILQYLDEHPNMEGVVFQQNHSLVKLLTLHNNEKFELQEFDTFPEYKKLQEYCVKHMTIKAKTSNRLDMKLVQTEVAKEITHDSWIEFRQKYFTLIEKSEPKHKVDNLIMNSTLFTDIVESLKDEHESFRIKMTKKHKQMIAREIKTYINNNKDILSPYDVDM